MNPKTLALFGAGKIGRSFIAQIFARNGYDVVFIDLDLKIIDALNNERRYRVITLNNDYSQSEYWVEGVRGIDGRNTEACLSLLAEVPLVATSVGAGAIPAVCKTLASALQTRRDRGLQPFDLILAENMRNSVAVVRRELSSAGLAEGEHPGLIEASIGKTSPDIPSDEQKNDPLLVYADSYNTLIVSAEGWRGEAPVFPELYLSPSINAYVDRKLFIHNLAHCALAYLGYQKSPETKYIHEIVAQKEIRRQVEELIGVSAEALIKEYPGEFDEAKMQQYQRDVLDRISNPALQDTLWRIGRDIPRKLGRTERIVGSLLLALRHGLSGEYHVQLYEAALAFYACNEQGEPAAVDRQFHRDICRKGVEHALYSVSELRDAVAGEKKVAEEIARNICSKKLPF